MQQPQFVGGAKRATHRITRRVFRTVAYRRIRRASASAAKWFAWPSLLYLTAFTAFTWPWMPHFSSRFFANDGDGLQNVWNIWWVNHAVTVLHQSPWHTNVLHFPHGTTLLGQTMNPFNGFVGIFLLRWFSLAQTYNLLVIFSFVIGGVTAFWLCHEFTHHYRASLIGGFAFTFSAYHFASAMGFMQLVSLEWIPLFVMLWWRLLEQPSRRNAIGAAITLFLVLWCDYYYFLYCASTALLVAVYLAKQRRLRASKYLLVFAATAALLCAPLPVQLLLYNRHDKLGGFHDARVFSTDAFSTFVDGGFWRFGRLTNWYWQHVPAPLSGSSAYLGIVVLAAFWLAARGRNRLHRDALFWVTTAAIFWVLSLGPRLLIAGHSYSAIPLPYAALERLIPPLKLGGNPYRTIVIVTLATSVLVAIVLAKFDWRSTRVKVVIALFVGALAIEMWPAAMPTTAVAYPNYVSRLRQLHDGAAVFDGAATSATYRLYYQTVHEHPITFGYISRLPTSVEQRDAPIARAAKLGNVGSLCTKFRVRYFTTRPDQPLQATSARLIYSGADALMYDLKTTPSSPC